MSPLGITVSLSLSLLNQKSWGLSGLSGLSFWNQNFLSWCNSIWWDIQWSFQTIQKCESIYFFIWLCTCDGLKLVSHVPFVCVKRGTFFSMVLSRACSIWYKVSSNHSLCDFRFQYWSCSSFYKRMNASKLNLAIFAMCDMLAVFNF